VLAKSRVYELDLELCFCKQRISTRITEDYIKKMSALRKTILRTKRVLREYLSSPGIYPEVESVHAMLGLFPAEDPILLLRSILTGEMCISKVPEPQNKMLKRAERKIFGEERLRRFEFLLGNEY
jgi:hypothetical protein